MENKTSSERLSCAGLSGPEREIIRRIGEKGPITFAEFMEAALYWPDGGYYTSRRGPWGPEGDYITSVDISPVFSLIISRQMREMWDLLGSPKDFALLEAGPGRGLLSKGIIEALKREHPALYSIIKIRLVEKNPHIRSRGTEGWPDEAASKISWHDSLEDLPAPFIGCILSNELLDSFPVHRFRNDSGLKEVFVGREESSFIEIEGPPSTPEIEGYFKDLGLEPPSEGEVNLNAKGWIRKAARMLGSGFVLTIDYGLPARELYAPERRGTLLCHFRHTLNTNPYINIGAQDITTHVDFTMLRNEGAKAGLETSGFATQKNFLFGLGIAEELKDAPGLGLDDFEKVEFNRSIARLVAPGGAGDTFKVMIQHKGLKKPALRGFSFRDLSKYL